MTDTDKQTDQSQALKVSNRIKQEHDDQLKKKAALTMQALDEQQLNKGPVQLENSAPSKEKPENNESLRDIYTRCLGRYPSITNFLTWGIRDFKDSDGNLAVLSSSKEYKLLTCQVSFPDNDTIKCGKGWHKEHLAAMVDAAKEKGWDAIVITKNTSDEARQILQEICQEKGIPIVNARSVSAKLESEDTPTRKL